MINTKKAPRRVVRYQSLREALADADRLAEADAPTTGNWSKGQIFEHLAAIMDMAVDGAERQAPFPSRLIGQYVIKPMIFKRGMTPGFQLPKWAAKAIAEDTTQTDEALEHLRRSTERFETASQLHPHPFFGSLDRDGWNTLLTRHAELHMSFIAEPTASQN